MLKFMTTPFLHWLSILQLLKTARSQHLVYCGKIPNKISSHFRCFCSVYFLKEDICSKSCTWGIKYTSTCHMQRPPLVAQKYVCKEFPTPLYKGVRQFCSEVPLDTSSHIAICYFTGPHLPPSNKYFSNLLVFLALLGNMEAASNFALSYPCRVQVLFDENSGSFPSLPPCLSSLLCFTSKVLHSNCSSSFQG